MKMKRKGLATALIYIAKETTVIRLIPLSGILHLMIMEICEIKKLQAIE